MVILMQVMVEVHGLQAGPDPALPLDPELDNQLQNVLAAYRTRTLPPSGVLNLNPFLAHFRTATGTFSADHQWDSDEYIQALANLYPVFRNAIRSERVLRYRCVTCWSLSGSAEAASSRGDAVSEELTTGFTPTHDLIQPLLDAESVVGTPHER